MIHVSQAHLIDAVQATALVAKDGEVDASTWVRIYMSTGGDQLCLTASSGYITVLRMVPLTSPAPDNLDVAVQGDRLLAACRALRKGEVEITHTPTGGLQIKQDDGLEAGLEIMDVTLCPVTPGFGTMVSIYQGPNPAKGLASIRNIAASNSGNTPIANVLLMLPGRSYLGSHSASSRCEFSLVGPEQQIGPVAVQMQSLWILDHLEDPIICYQDENRLLVCDKLGWAVIAKWAGQIGTLPAVLEKAFASLRQIGQVKIPRVDALRAASAAQTVLKGATATAVFVLAECQNEKIVFSANVGRHRYKETIAGWSSGHFKIPIHIGRLVDFLRGSGDEAVYLRVMDSTVNPNPMSFVHLVDSRVHEAIGLPTNMTVEVVASPP